MAEQPQAINSLGVLPLRGYSAPGLSGSCFMDTRTLNPPRWRVQEPGPGFGPRRILFCCAGFDAVLSRWMALTEVVERLFGMLREHKLSIVAPDSRTKVAPQDMRNWVKDSLSGSLSANGMAKGEETKRGTDFQRANRDCRNEMGGEDGGVQAI